MNWFRRIFIAFSHRQNASTTTRYMFPAFLGSVAAASLFALSPVAIGTYVIVGSTSQAVEVGDVYPVDIFVAAAEPVNAVELQLEIDNKQASVFGVDRGQSVITLWTEEPVITDNSVTLRGGTFQRGFLGKHLIATINLRAEAPGPHEFSIQDIRLIAGDGKGTEVDVSNNDASSFTVFHFDESTSADDMNIVTLDTITTDIDDDGVVTLRDMSVFVGAWSNQTAFYDFSGDGEMTFTDFSILLSDLFTN